MILEGKALTLWLMILTGSVGGIAGAQIGVEASGTPWLPVVLSVIGFMVGLLLAVFGWLLKQIHKELRDVVVERLREIDEKLVGFDKDQTHQRETNERLQADIRRLDEEKLSEHRTNSLIARYHAEHHTPVRGDREPRRRGL